MNGSCRTSLSFSFPICKMGISCCLLRQAVRTLWALGPLDHIAHVLELVRFSWSEDRGQPCVGPDKADGLCLLQAAIMPLMMNFNLAGPQGLGRGCGPSLLSKPHLLCTYHVPGTMLGTLWYLSLQMERITKGQRIKTAHPRLVSWQGADSAWRPNQPEPRPCLWEWKNAQEGICSQNLVCTCVLLNAARLWKIPVFVTLSAADFLWGESKTHPVCSLQPLGWRPPRFLAGLARVTDTQTQQHQSSETNLEYFSGVSFWPKWLVCL